VGKNTRAFRRGQLLEEEGGGGIVYIHTAEWTRPKNFTLRENEKSLSRAAGHEKGKTEKWRRENFLEAIPRRKKICVVFH